MVGLQLHSPTLTAMMAVTVVMVMIHCFILTG